MLAGYRTSVTVGLIVLAAVLTALFVYFTAQKGGGKEQAFGDCIAQYAKISEERKSDRYKDEFVIGCMKAGGYSMALQNSACFSQGFSSSHDCFTPPAKP